MELQTKLRKLEDKEYAKKCLRFFKTEPGEYAHGDKFLGIKVPVLRTLAKENIHLSLSDIKKIIKSEYHEERMLGLFILVNKYNKAKDFVEEERLFNIYISSFKYINNWDLVDVTCPHIVGKYLINKDRSILYEWAKSDDLWTKRIAMITNWWFVRKGDLKDVYKIADILLEDDHDLIHKAVGWMLREAGKKDEKRLKSYLKKHYQSMPRVMLRYSIEKFPKEVRSQYLKGLI